MCDDSSRPAVHRISPLSLRQTFPGLGGLGVSVVIVLIGQLA